MASGGMIMQIVVPQPSPGDTALVTNAATNEASSRLVTALPDNLDAVLTIPCGVMPDTYDGAGVDVIGTFRMASDVTHTFDADLAFENEEGQVIGTAGFYAVQSSVDNALPGTLIPFTVTWSFTTTQMDGVAVGDLFRLKLIGKVSTDDRVGHAYPMTLAIYNA